LNPDCADFQKTSTGNIIKKGFNAKGNQRFKCKTCGVRFPEIKSTVFYNRHLTEEQIVMICKFLVEKSGVMAILLQLSYRQALAAFIAASILVKSAPPSSSTYQVFADAVPTKPKNEIAVHTINIPYSFTFFYILLKHISWIEIIKAFRYMICCNHKT
jgi:hypothetical protein